MWHASAGNKHMAWDEWLSGVWPDLTAGRHVVVPEWLPSPEWSGMQSVENAWVRSFDDGHELVVTQVGPNGLRVAEVRKPSRLDVARKKVQEWASDHPVAALLVGGILVVTVIVLVASVARAVAGPRSQKSVEPQPDEESREPAPDAGSASTSRPAFNSVREVVSARFAELLAGIQPNVADLRRADSHAKSVEAALRDEFSVNRLLIVGSHSRGTAVRESSDVDYFAVVARGDTKWGDDYVSSETVLRNVRRALENRFKSTEIRKDLQAVVVEFGAGEDPVDVVPAVFLGMSSNARPLYRIPNGMGGWLETSPEGHNKYIDEANRRSGKKLRGVAQLLKCWRDCRASVVPIQSFYLELQLAAASVCSVRMTYAECIVAALERLHVTECQPIADPLGISGKVPATSTEAKRLTALEAVRAGLGVATHALASEEAGDLLSAQRAWSRFFNRASPQ